MIYSPNEIQATYQRVNDLLVTKYIIKNYSTNSQDIRKVAIDGLDLKKVKSVLELGCGYGFFIEILKERLDPNANIIGIDLVENNREAYLHTIGSIGYHGEFIRENVEIIKTFDAASMDLIIACYSLYFFPHIIEHIVRVLKPGGIFIAITHSKYSLNEILSMIRDCLIEMGIDNIYTLSLQDLIMSFSTENGRQLLEHYFRSINFIEYKNSMKFSYEHVDDCVYYIEKKRQLLYKEVLDAYPDRILDLEMCLSRKVYERAKRYNEINITKDDSVFRCFV